MPLADLLPKEFADKLEDDKYKVFGAYKDALVTRPSWKVRPSSPFASFFSESRTHARSQFRPVIHPEQETFDEEYVMPHMKHVIEKRRAAAAAEANK